MKIRKLRIQNLLGDLRPWLMMLVLQIPSYRTIFKFVPYPIISVIFLNVLAFIGYAIIFQNIWVRKMLTYLLNSYYITIFFIALLIGVNYYLYPRVDARKYIGRGSTADDALIETAKSFLAQRGLYNVRLYDGAPVSPGPGWILLNLPFTTSGLYFLLTPFYIGILSTLYIIFYRDKLGANLVLLSLTSSPIFWELMVTGHDLIALGFGLIILLFLLDKYFTSLIKAKNSNFLYQLVC